ncbi:MAG: hypothetical protein WA323_19030 [Candidatus Nitrosopolaris sp.]
MTTQNIQDSGMTKAYLVDLLKQHPASIERQEEGKYDNRRYYDQAHNLLITDAFKPVPYFIICLSDLSPIELYDLDSRDRAFVRATLVYQLYQWPSLLFGAQIGG